MLFIAIVLYLVTTFFLALIGVERQNEGVKIFIISLLLTPIAGLLYLVSRKKNYSKMTYYYCEHCDYVFPLKMRNCPICEENGYKVRLKKYESPHEIGQKIPVVDFA
jgi:hypothetical protein